MKIKNEIKTGFIQGKIRVLGKAKVSGYTVVCECGTFTCREKNELYGNCNDACLECLQIQHDTKH